MPAPTPIRRSGKACVIGSGPNGLAAAIVLAQAGMDVEVFEAESQPGGAARTMEPHPPRLPPRLRLGSPSPRARLAVLPFAAARRLRPRMDPLPRPARASPRRRHRCCSRARPQRKAPSSAALGPDGRSLAQPHAALRHRWARPHRRHPATHPAWPKHPLLLARFGLTGLQPASFVARRRFRGEPARALFAGLAAHSFLALNHPSAPPSAMVLGIAAHAVGWPIPRGGAQSLTNALAGYLTHLGGRITTSTAHRQLSRPTRLRPHPLRHHAAPAARARRRSQAQPLSLRVTAASSRASNTAPPPSRSTSRSRGPSPGTPRLPARRHRPRRRQPRRDRSLRSRHGRGPHAARPFVLVAQPTLFDPTRAPAGKHIAWAYCHVPNGSTEDMLDRIESQIERFAAGFRDSILARHVSSPADLEAMDANLVGGDIGGGAVNLRQLLFRPTRRQYRTSAPEYLPLLLVDSTRRRRPRHVRSQRRPHGPARPPAFLNPVQAKKRAAASSATTPPFRLRTLLLPLTYRCVRRPSDAPRGSWRCPWTTPAAGCPCRPAPRGPR
jgi:phytoene dehydrogenase-like protein